jgi:methylated-DNA-[protein]-cysteine S-methyltransferase
MSTTTTTRSALAYTTVESPIGELLLVGEREGEGDGEGEGDRVALHALHMQDAARPRAIDAAWERHDDGFAAIVAQLTEYFDGGRSRFDIRLALHGNPFQLRVWEALCEIPFGETTSYGALARRIGHPDAARAVGVANGQNPVAVIVPCHRVIGADGSLVGYGGGLERKRPLLELERGVMRL